VPEKIPTELQNLGPPGPAQHIAAGQLSATLRGMPGRRHWSDAFERGERLPVGDDASRDTPRHKQP
jgi:hypothetical protein